MNGLRVSKTEGGATTRFLLDGASVLEELDVNNAATRIWLNHPQVMDEQIAFQQFGALFSPLTDALGTIYAISDSSGSIVRRYEFDAYGQRSNVGGIGPDVPFGFTGREHDASGLVYHRDRYRDARGNRWTQPDRAAFVDGPNIYQYVTSSPIAQRDPTGQDSVLNMVGMGNIGALANYNFGNSVAIGDELQAMALTLRMQPITPCAAMAKLVATAVSRAATPLEAGFALFRYGTPQVGTIDISRVWGLIRPTGFQSQFDDPTGSDQVHHAMSATGLALITRGMLGPYLGSLAAVYMGFTHELRNPWLGRRFEGEDIMVNRAALFFATDLETNFTDVAARRLSLRAFCTEDECKPE